jgi:hypothetical protein
MSRKQLTLGGLLTLGLAGCAMAVAQPFGSRDDVGYAADLWQNMVQQRLAGNDAVMSTPYQGVHPHGAILDTIDTRISVGGEAGTLIIKRNYGGEGVTKEAVADDPGKWLKAVTVMFQRPGYDPENLDWFWVKYAPDGSVMQNPKGMALAGRVGKGGTEGCIACHKAAPGGDLVFNNDRFAP